MFRETIELYSIEPNQETCVPIIIRSLKSHFPNITPIRHHAKDADKLRKQKRQNNPGFAL